MPNNRIANRFEQDRPHCAWRPASIQKAKRPPCLWLPAWRTCRASLPAHRFLIPPEAHWRQVRQVAANVGQAIQAAMRAIETANPDTLYGICGDAQWINKDRLSDVMLRDLVESFSTLDLTAANLPEDELGQGYEYLIKKFADDAAVFPQCRILADA